MVSAKSLLTHSGGLRGLYGDILSFIPDHCSLLLEITRGPLPSGHCAAGAASGGALSGSSAVMVKGFDFLVNSIWPEIVAVLEKKVSVIFAPGNPDTFHKVILNITVLVQGSCQWESLVQGSRQWESLVQGIRQWESLVWDSGQWE